ncbi:MAG: PolC-type DNA polymerase III [Bacillota bacterium]
MVTVTPSCDDFRLTKIAKVLGIEEDPILECLKVVSIGVNTDEGAWSVCLDVVDPRSWARHCASLSRTEVELRFAEIGQALRNRIPELETVRWGLPEEYQNKLGNGPNSGDKAPQDGVLLGRPIRTQPIPIREVTGGERESVTLAGQVVEVTWRQAQSGDIYGAFVLTDNEDSITVRVFPKEGKVDEIEEGVWVIARGRARLDRLDSEPVLICNDLCLFEPKVRHDTAPEKRVELHLHTKMSALDCVLELDEAIALASAWGHPAVAITDHGVVQAFPEAYRLGKKYGMKIIYGIEAYLVEDDEKGQAFHIILLAKDKQGLRNLYELVTLSHLDHFYRTPRIPRAKLAARREGLLVGSACEAGEVYRAVLAGLDDEQLKRVASFYDYLEIQPLSNNQFLINSGEVSGEEDLIRINTRIYELSKSLGIPCVATSDVHYLNPEDEIFRTLLLSGKGMNDSGEKPAPLYFRTTDELLEEVSAYLGAEAAREVVVTNTRAIAAAVEDLAPIPEGSFFPHLPNADEILRELTEQGANRLFGMEWPEIVRQRIDKELSAIIGGNFSSLYLIAIRMVEKSLEDGYLVGSRGSVGSSLVAMLTGITEVNPLPPHYVCLKCHWNKFVLDGSYGSGFDLPAMQCPECGSELRRDGQNIPFETFMGFTGEKVPDIDLNFSGEEQGKIFKFASTLLGKQNVYRAGTIATVAKKTAFGFVKHYEESRGKGFRRAEVTRLAKGIEGVKRTTGQHPGGVMVIPKGMDVLDFTPLQYPADDRSSGAITTHFDYDSLSGHLVKVDILGHDDPTVLKILHELTGVDPTKIPMDDPETLKLFSGENPDSTVGIPEFGTRFVRNMLCETRPKCFADFVRISGLSHGTDVWANNARDIIRDGIATLDQVIASREDIYLYLMEKGMDPASAFGIAEKVRKGRPLSDEDVSQMRALSVPDWYIESCKKITYLFPKAHAAAYVTNSFRIAYFKVHHPLAFYSTYFSFTGNALTTEFMYLEPTEWRGYINQVNSNPASTAREQDIAAALELALEMAERGFSFGRHHLYLSHATRYVPEGDCLIPPFTSIPGLGSRAAAAIVKARQQGEFESVEDFRRRTGLGKKLCEVLRDHGVFEGLPETAQLALF